MAETSAKKGSEDNIMAALSYFLAPLTSIIFYLMYKDKGNKFMMFHAVQSGIYGIVMFVVSFGWMFLSTILSVITGGIVALCMLPISLLLMAVFFCSWLFLMYKAYSGEKFKIPVIGDLAEKHSG